MDIFPSQNFLMLSLRQIIDEQQLQSGDLGDSRPTKASYEEVLAMDIVTSDNIFDRISVLIHSTSQSQIIWALNKIQALVPSNPATVTFFPDVISHFKHKKKLVELHAIVTASVYSHFHSDLVYDKMIPAVLERVAEFPAIEYVQTIVSLFSSLDESEVRNDLVPKLISLLQLSEAHQYFASGVLESIPIDKWIMTPVTLNQMLVSPILVNNCLASMTFKSISYFQPDYLKITLPQLLLSLANSKDTVRLGAVKTVLKCCSLEDTPAYIMILTSFSWGATNDSIAIILLENCSVIMEYKKGQLNSKLREVASKLLQTGNTNTKLSFPQVLMNSYQFFNQQESLWHNYIKLLAEDPDPIIRANLLDKMPDLFDFFKIASYQDQLVKIFLDFFKDNSQKVTEKIPSSQMISHIPANKLPFIFPRFMKLCNHAVNNWRNFKKFLTAFLMFPDNIIQQFSLTILTPIISALSRNVHALSDPSMLAISRLLRVSNETDQAAIIGQLLKSFYASPNHFLRSFFIELVPQIFFSVPYDLLTTKIWPPTVLLSKDPVVSVKVSFVKVIPKIYHYFKKVNDLMYLKQIEAIFAILKNETDSYLSSVISNVTELMNRKPEEGYLGGTQISLPSLSKSSGTFLTDVQGKPTKHLSVTKFSRTKMVSATKPKRKSSLQPSRRNPSIPKIHRSPLYPL